MTYTSLLKSAVCILCLQLSTTMVWASTSGSDYEEVTYDELVNELNTKKSTLEKKQQSSLKELSLGVGFVHSYSQMNFRNQNSDRTQNGLQLALGMNLNSPSLYAEGVFRSLSGSSIAQEDLQVQQIDARLAYKKQIDSLWRYNLLSGISARLIQASNSERGYNSSEFTPAFTAGIGAQAEVYKNVRFGFEMMGRTSLIGKNSDRNSVDFGIRLDTSL